MMSEFKYIKQFKIKFYFSKIEFRNYKINTNMNICDELTNNGNRCTINKNTEKYNYQDKDIYLCKIHVKVLNNNNLKIYLDEKDILKRDRIDELVNNFHKLDINKNIYDDFCGKININNLIKALVIHKHVFITGSTGIGKSLSIKLIFDNKKYDVIYYEYGKLTDFFNNNNNKSIRNKKRVIVIDNIEELDNEKIQEMTKIIKFKIINKNNIVILICNDSQINYKEVKILKNYCYNIKFITPKTNEILQYIKKICIKNKINLKDDKINEIILLKQNDIRSIINEILFYMDSISNLNVYKKDVDLNIFETFNRITSKITLKEKMNIFEKHDYLDFMLYENYCNDKNVDISYVNEITEKICLYDIFNCKEFSDSYLIKQYKGLMFANINKNFPNIKFPSYFINEKKIKKEHEKIEENYYNYKKYTNISIQDFTNYKDLIKI